MVARLMRKEQWMKYLEMMETYSKNGTLTHEDKVALIDHLINKERKEWDKIELDNIKRSCALEKKSR